MKALLIILIGCLMFGCTNISQVNEARIDLLQQENAFLKDQNEKQDLINQAIVVKLNELITLQSITLKKYEELKAEINHHFL